MAKKPTQPSVDRALRCPRCFIGQADCRVGTPLSLVREGDWEYIVCPKCGFRPDNSDTQIKGDASGGTNEPEREYPC